MQTAAKLALQQQQNNGAAGRGKPALSTCRGYKIIHQAGNRRHQEDYQPAANFQMAEIGGAPQPALRPRDMFGTEHSWPLFGPPKIHSRQWGCFDDRLLRTGLVRDFPHACWVSGNRCQSRKAFHLTWCVGVNVYVMQQTPLGKHAIEGVHQVLTDGICQVIEQSGDTIYEIVLV